MSISTAWVLHPQRNHGLWLATKVGLVFVAILIFSLTAAALEARLGAGPSGSPISWELSGE